MDFCAYLNERIRASILLILALIFPSRRMGYFKYIASIKLPHKPLFEEGIGSYLLIKKGLWLSSARINLKECADDVIRGNEKLPLVSCLMITRNRFKLAKSSIHCFLKQTYPKRELIILDDGSDNQLENWVSALESPLIRFFRIPDTSKKLGVLRNLSRDIADGEYIAQWDDDDLAHPERLSYQMALIILHHLDGCTLQREQLWFPKKKRLGYSNRRLWEGSMVCINEKLPLYHERRKGEESDAVYSLALNGNLALLDMPQLYTYCFHGSNTFDESHFDTHWEHSTKVFNSREYEEFTSVLKEMI